MANTAVVYGREYDGEPLTFTASGGLIHSALVLQDRETKSYWAIMAGEAIAGKKLGTPLRQLEIGERMRWKEWLQKHPDTLVLSVAGQEDAPKGYGNYYIAPHGFRNMRAKDNRMRTKEPVFAFSLGGRKFAVKHKDIAGGRLFDIDSSRVFLFRLKKSGLHRSTVAFIIESLNFQRENGEWADRHARCRFDRHTRQFVHEGEPCAKKMLGIDTFWYTWSLTNPDTQVLK